jgi:chromosomal replication initiator protein
MITASPVLWAQALEDLRSKLDEESFSTWIEPTRFVSHEDDQVVLAVPSLFYRNWLANNFEEHIIDSLAELLGRRVRIDYRIDGDEDEPPMTTATQSLSNTERQAMGLSRRRDTKLPTELITCPLNQNYSFDNFVVGESNRFAYAAAQAVADPQSQAYNPLFIYGGVGLGKTHLMQAIGQQLKTFGKHINVLYVSSEAFMNAFIEGVAQKKLTEFRNCFRHVDLLMVDDVQFFAGAEQTQTEFFHTFNVLFDAGKKIVLSSDHPPKELHSLEERLRSRFEWGLLVDIQPPDLETRVAILRSKARMMNLELDPEITIFVAERIKSNLRKLEGALTRLGAHSSMTRRPITLESARSLLGPFLVGSEPQKITIEKIQTTACNYFSITMSELIGANRSRKFSLPRQIAAYLSRELTDCSYPEIARKFGGRDHTSIIHAHRKIKREMAQRLDLQNIVRYLAKLIKEEPTIARPQ